MKRLQLFGTSKYFLLNSKDPDCKRNDDQTSNDTESRKDGISLLDKDQKRCKLHLLKLPPKILSHILESLDMFTLLSLCEVNAQLYEIISNQFLYANIVLDNKLSLLKFNALIHSGFHTANALLHRNCDEIVSQNTRFLVRSLEFKNPQCQDSLLKYSKYYRKVSQTSVIGGSYTFDVGGTSSYTAGKNLSSPLTRTQTNGEASKFTYSASSHPGLEDSNHAAADCYKTLSKLESKYSQYTYIELMLDIMDYLPNLSHIILSKVEPCFKIPLWYSSFNDGSREFFKKIINGQQSLNNNDLRTFEISQQFVSDYEKKFYSLPRVKTLEIRGSLDKRHKHQVHLRPNLLCCFGIINELILQDVIIDTESLDTPLEFIPLHLRLDPSGVYDLHSSVHLLTLKSCHIVPGNGILKLFHQYFKCVKNLELLALTSKYDMLLCSCFPSLTDLTIDCNSHCFVSEHLVSDNYYYKEDFSSNDYAIDSDDDGASISETLLDHSIDNSLQAPPPTTPVVLSLDLKYLTVASSNNQGQIKKKMALITKSQGAFFKHLRIPEFHYFYHYFKELWDRLPRKNININIVNIPFTNVFPLSPSLYCEKILKSLDDDQQTLIPSSNNNFTNSDEEQEENRNYYWDSIVRSCLIDNAQNLRNQDQYSDISPTDLFNELDSDMFNNYKNSKYFQDIPNVNLWCFLKSLSKFKSVKIHMLRKWLFCTPRTRYDWELLLKPVLNVNVPIEVRDRDGFVIYSYGAKKLLSRAR